MKIHDVGYINYPTFSTSEQSLGEKLFNRKSIKFWPIIIFRPNILRHENHRLWPGPTHDLSGWLFGKTFQDPDKNRTLILQVVGNPRELSGQHWQHFNTGTARKMPKTSPCPMMTVVDPIISIDTLQCNALLLSGDFCFWCLCCLWIHWKQQCVNRWNQDRSQMAATIGKLWLRWFMKQWSQMFWFLCITSLSPPGSCLHCNATHWNHSTGFSLTSNTWEG